MNSVIKRAETTPLLQAVSLAMRVKSATTKMKAQSASQLRRLQSCIAATPRKSVRIPGAEALAKEKIKDEEPFDESACQELVFVLCAALHKYGSSTHITESVCKAVSISLNLDASFAILPNQIMCSFNASLFDPEKPALTRMLVVAPGIDLNKLGQCDALCLALTRKTVAATDAVAQLRGILEQEELYSKRTQLLWHGLMAAGSCVVWFGGSWLEGFLSCLGGLVVGGICTYVSPVGNLARVENLLGCVLISLLTLLLASVGHSKHLCYLIVEIGSIVWLLPGFSLTIGITELASGALVNGAAHLSATLLAMLQVGFGLLMSSSITRVNEGSASSCFHETPAAVWYHNPPPKWVLPAIAVVPAVASAILSGASRKQFWAITLASMVAYFVSFFLDGVTSDEFGSFLAALALGCFSVFHATSGQHPMIVVIPGICMLVPGSLGVRAVALLLGSPNTVMGIQSIVSAFGCALSLSLGLMCAKVLSIPIHRHVMGVISSAGISNTIVESDLL